MSFGMRPTAPCVISALLGSTRRTSPFPPVPGTIALRSSGYFNTAGLQVWAQHSTYVANYDKGRGLLILHGLFIESRSLERLRDNIIALSDAVHHAFLTAIAG